MDRDQMDRTAVLACLKTIAPEPRRFARPADPAACGITVAWLLLPMVVHAPDPRVQFTAITIAGVAE